MRRFSIVFLCFALITAWGSVSAQTYRYDDEQPPTPFVPTPRPTSTPRSEGTGLRGEYFNDKDLHDHVFSRVDATIDFRWSTRSPDPRVLPDTFSVRWNGTVKPEFDGNYIFSVYVDNGVRLWVDNKLIIDKWRTTSPRTVQGSIDVVAGRAIPIQLEYYESVGGASVRLYWKSLTQQREIIPKTRLYPTS